MPLIKGEHTLLSEKIQRAYGLGASDVDLAPGMPVVYRVDGQLLFDDGPAISDSDTRSIFEIYLSEDNNSKYRARKSYDISMELENTRARLHFYQTRAGINLSCRLVALEPRTMDELLIPPVVKGWMKSRSIVVVAGDVGMGKTTSLGSMVDHINSMSTEKIMILEDPVEYIHKRKKSLIVQREVGVDSPSYSDALRDIAREQCDTVVVGEVRNMQAMESVFMMAESGLRVFTSIHAKSAIGTIERIVNMFPPSDYGRIYKRLSATLSGILCQQLLPKKNGGRLLGAEVLTNSELASGAIGDGDIKKLASLMERGSEELCTLKRYIEKLDPEVLAYLK